MADSDSGAERTEQATPQKRQRLRKEGQVAVSSEVGVALTMLLVAGLLAWGFPLLAGRMAGLFRSSLALDASVLAFHDGAAVLAVHRVMAESLQIVGPVALSALALGLAASVAQVGVHVNFELVSPNWSRLDPSGWFKRMASVDLPVTLAKSIFKGLGIVAIALYALREEPGRLHLLAHVPIAALGPHFEDVALGVVLRVAAALAVVAGIDVLWTRHRFEERAKMSREEVKQEMKEQEGDPLLKAVRKRRAREMLSKSLERQVKEATVVSVNPTHYAVALRYLPARDGAPVVIAKGIDFKAKRIRAIAEKLDIPVVEDVPLTRALYKATKEGDQIPFELFLAVARLLSLVYKMRGHRTGGDR